MDTSTHRPGRDSFALISAGFLAVAAAAKLVSTTSRANIMDFPDPLLGLSNRHVLLLVAVVELLVAGCLLMNKAAPLKYLCAAWLGGSFLLYRLALALLKPGIPCKCLGTLTDTLHISNRSAGLLLTAASLYLLLGGLWLYARPLRRSSRR